MNQTQAVETIDPPPIAVRPDVPALLAQGGVTVAIQLCGALLLWQVRGLLREVKQ